MFLRALPLRASILASTTLAVMLFCIAFDAHAQTNPLPGFDVLSQPPTDNQVLGIGEESLPSLDPLHTVTTSDTQANGSQPQRAPIENPGGIDGFIYTICMTIGGFFLSIGGWFFNSAIDLLVVKMGSILNGSLGTAIKSLWVVVRDICNLVFIFGLIYVGLKTIWNAGDSNTKRMLTGIIAAALLINFSLFFAQFVVDFANVAAYQIYRLIEIEDGAGMADAFLQYADIQTYADTQSGYLQEAVKGEATNLPSSMIIGYGFMMMIFMLIAAFVFIAGAVLLVARFVTLVILMIFSPILLVGMAIPALGKQTDKYLRQFINSAFVAPAFMFMLYLSVVVLQAIDIKQDGSSFAAALMNGGAGGFINLILYFGILIAFLLASLLVAKQMGAAGADKMVSIGNSMRGRVQSFVGRNTAGRLSNTALNKYDKYNAQLTSTRSGRFARGLISTLSLGGLSDRTVRGTLEAGKKEKFGGSYSFEDDKNYAKEERKRLSAERQEQARSGKIEAAIEEIAKKGSGSQSIDPNVMKELADAMKGMTEKQLKELDVKVLANENVAVHLNEKNIETIEKSGEFSDEEIAKIKDARKQGFISIAQTGLNANGTPMSTNAYNNTRTPEWLAQKGTDEVAKMPMEVFKSTAMAPHLTPAMVESKIKGGASASDLRAIQVNIDNQIANDQRNAANGVAGAGAYTKQWKNWVRRTSIGPRLGLQNV